jgi:hypothetical protein
MCHPFRNDASHMIVQRILDNLRMTTVTCYLVSVFVCLSFVISVA